MAFLELRNGGDRVRTRAVELVHADGDTLWIRLPDGVMTIGRRITSAAAAHHLVVDQDTVARCHCAITAGQRGFRLTDRNSTSGTYLNDIKLGVPPPESPDPAIDWRHPSHDRGARSWEGPILREGDRIPLGRVLAIFRERMPFERSAPYR